MLVSDQSGVALLLGKEKLFAENCWLTNHRRQSGVVQGYQTLLNVCQNQGSWTKCGLTRYFMWPWRDSQMDRLWPNSGSASSKGIRWPLMSQCGTGGCQNSKTPSMRPKNTSSPDLRDGSDGSFLTHPVLVIAGRPDIFFVLILADKASRDVNN